MTTRSAASKVDQLKARIAALEQVCADMYQVAGAIGAPVRILDQLHAAASGKRLPHESVLPFDDAECVPLPPLKKPQRAKKR
jgi:hypothetical protein